MRLKLTIQPIPVSTWGRSLANRLPRKDWDKIRYDEYRRADYTCEICEEINLSLHCHEVWSFEERKKIQRLMGFEVCCELCHDVHHFGRSKATKTKVYIDRLIRHWCVVNKKTLNDFRLYESQIFEINKKRANRFYVVKVGRRILV